jgi:hypothetical protein
MVVRGILRNTHILHRVLVILDLMFLI